MLLDPTDPALKIAALSEDLADIGANVPIADRQGGNRPRRRGSCGSY